MMILQHKNERDNVSSCHHPIQDDNDCGYCYGRQKQQEHDPSFQQRRRRQLQQFVHRLPSFVVITMLMMMIMISLYHQYHHHHIMMIHAFTTTTTTISSQKNMVFHNHIHGSDKITQQTKRSLVSSFVLSSNYHQARRQLQVGTSLYYQNSNNHNNNNNHDDNTNIPSSSQNNNNNAWHVLSNTEQWISQTLANVNTDNNDNTSNDSNSDTNDTKNRYDSRNMNNPYVRKEVSYICISLSNMYMVIASIFRHLKEIRVLGETHLKSTDSSSNTDSTSSTSSNTMRQTHVLVIPNVMEFNTQFHIFDQMITHINIARRNARDYYTTTTISSSSSDTDTIQQSQSSNPNFNDRNIAINCAHLHPQFGMIPTTKDDDDDNEEDEKYQQYKKHKLMARQSPYPTIVMEVRVMPSSSSNQQYNSQQPEQEQPSSTTITNNNNNENDVSLLSDRQKLELLFRQSAYIKQEQPPPNDDNDTSTTTNTMENDTISTQQQQLPSTMSKSTTPSSQTVVADDDFWDSIGSKIGNEIIVPKSSIQVAQEFISDLYHTTTDSSTSTTLVSNQSSFTISNTDAVDEAYEFVFTNIAMLFDEIYQQEQSSSQVEQQQSYQYYLVLPNFLIHAATSFEKFSKEIVSIYHSTQSSSSSSSSHHPYSLSITTYHPEHIQAHHRSPIPILAISCTTTSSL